MAKVDGYPMKPLKNFNILFFTSNRQIQYVLKQLIFATHNLNKVKELKYLLPKSLDLKSLADVNFNTDIPETGRTLKQNASIKAEFIKQHLKTDCFADDTGLEVDVLNGQPGVYSARFAGEDKDDSKNINKLLTLLKDNNNRKARFKTVITLILGEKKYYFEGVINGVITNTPKGNKGFGYDSIFRPYGHNITFAEMPIEEKNKISHRGLAVKKLICFLEQLTNNY